MSGRKYKKPTALFVVVTSDTEDVDVEVKIVRGGSLHLSLEDGNESSKPFRLGLPKGLRDQRQWICDSEGMRPAEPNEEW